MSPTLKSWLKCSLLAWPVVAGCSSQRAMLAPRNDQPAVAMAPASHRSLAAAKPAAGQPMMVTYQSNGRTVKNVSYVQPQPAPMTTTVIDPSAGRTIQAVAYAENQPIEQGPALAQDQVPPEGKTMYVIQHAPVVQKKIGAPKDDPAPHRTVVDITAANCFAHANDYSWLQGQVEYSRIGNGWRLRYASVDEADVHGGSVVLTGDGDLKNLRDGQMVRVNGRLGHADDRKSATPYRVESLQILGN